MKNRNVTAPRIRECPSGGGRSKGAGASAQPLATDNFCDDTGINKISIRDGATWVQLRDTLNVNVFEYDVDADGSKELYVVSTQPCGEWLRVFRARRRLEAR